LRQAPDKGDRRADDGSHFLSSSEVAVGAPMATGALVLPALR
jgi:hypothetical protein